MISYVIYIQCFLLLYLLLVDFFFCSFELYLFSLANRNPLCVTRNRLIGRAYGPGRVQIPKNIPRSPSLVPCSSFLVTCKDCIFDIWRSPGTLASENTTVGPHLFHIRSRVGEAHRHARVRVRVHSGKKRDAQAHPGTPRHAQARQVSQETPARPVDVSNKIMVKALSGFIL